MFFERSFIEFKFFDVVLILVFSSVFMEGRFRFSSFSFIFILEYVSVGFFGYRVYVRWYFVSFFVSVYFYDGFRVDGELFVWIDDYIEKVGVRL